MERDLGLAGHGESVLASRSVALNVDRDLRLGFFSRDFAVGHRESAREGEREDRDIAFEVVPTSIEPECQFDLLAGFDQIWIRPSANSLAVNIERILPVHGRVDLDGLCLLARVVRFHFDDVVQAMSNRKLR